MQAENYNNDRRSRGLFYRAGSRIYFRKETERRFFFGLTIFMLVFGICYKTGIF